MNRTQAEWPDFNQMLTNLVKSITSGIAAISLLANDSYEMKIVIKIFSVKNKFCKF